MFWLLKSILRRHINILHILITEYIRILRCKNLIFLTFYWNFMNIIYHFKYHFNEMKSTIVKFQYFFILSNNFIAIQDRIFQRKLSTRIRIFLQCGLRIFSTVQLRIQNSNMLYIIHLFDKKINSLLIALIAKKSVKREI